ncbi:hypothetical protein TNCV_4765161 [Trichonephila clavipes]|nr:hypothetical protein TNCV_4765161 [Trichonephila clavipes]
MEVCGVLVWGGIMLGSRTDLHIFDQVQSTEPIICNEILLPYVRRKNFFFTERYGFNKVHLFMDDNAPCHRTVAAEQLLENRRLAARNLTTSNDLEASIGAARRMGSNASTTH